MTHPKETNMIDEDKLRADLEASTPGPWSYEVDGFGGNRVLGFGFDTYDGSCVLAGVREESGCITFDQAVIHARLIAQAPTLAAAYLALKAENERLTAALEAWEKQNGCSD